MNVFHSVMQQKHQGGLGGSIKRVLHRVRQAMGSNHAGDMYELFNQLDGNRDGRLGKAELRKGLKRLGLNLDDEEVEAMMEHFDHDGEPRVSPSMLCVVYFR